jgi:hypothetical protein
LFLEALQGPFGQPGLVWWPSTVMTTSSANPLNAKEAAAKSSVGWRRLSNEYLYWDWTVQPLPGAKDFVKVSASRPDA